VVFGKDLVSTIEASEMLTVLNEHLRSFVPAEAILFLKESNGEKKVGKSPPLFDETEEMAARWAMDHREMAGHDTDTLPSAQGLWLPLTVAQKPLGALGFYAFSSKSLGQYRYLLEAFARVFALSLDRGS
jgi:two-component system sensor histidine kinase KdpD